VCGNGSINSQLLSGWNRCTHLPFSTLLIPVLDSRFPKGDWLMTGSLWVRVLHVPWHKHTAVKQSLSKSMWLHLPKTKGIVSLLDEINLLYEKGYVFPVDHQYVVDVFPVDHQYVVDVFSLWVWCFLVCLFFVGFFTLKWTCLFWLRQVKNFLKKRL
jgi:hypothetical protein